MDSGKDFFFGTKFSFFGGQGDLFSEASSLCQKFGAIARNSVPTLFLMPCCMGCSEINNINRHLICRLLPHTVILIKGALLCWMFKFSNAAL